MDPSVPRTRAAAALRMKQIALDNQSRMIRRLRAKLETERRESVAIKKEHESIQVALEASHTTIAGLTEIGLCMSKKIERMKAKKQQTREGLQEDNGAPAPFDDEWEDEPEEDPEEEGLEDIPIGEGEIIDEWNMFYLLNKNKHCSSFYPKFAYPFVL
ncbi:hypothetical protein F511_06294 [Dorcoceras hygrometricum]|uniref:Uncharacterized protein n=1 Tax=Dorcoceras hygrometricum TaxID=472368 RepID=A0A2Z7ADF8_9LAMI|nr:hypothetical protein F511_06294 [Dorcoceras hygrometricum]